MKKDNTRMEYKGKPYKRVPANAGGYCRGCHFHSMGMSCPLAVPEQYGGLDEKYICSEPDEDNLGCKKYYHWQPLDPLQMDLEKVKEDDDDASE